MQAGTIRHRVDIQAHGETRAENGEVIATWTSIATVWASVEPLSGRELWQAQQVQSEATIRVRLRYFSGVTTKHRLKFGERLLDIKAVINPAERNAELECLCTESV